MKQETINSNHKIRLASLRELQSQTQEELDALLPSVLRPQGGAFKGDMNLFGLFTACLFALIEYRTQLVWHVFFAHAVEIEEKLEIVGAYTKMKPKKHPWYQIDSTKGIRLGYFLLIAYWIYGIIVSFR